ncbi:MAG TPA: hypothetical protein VE733_21680 [Streptosporangiaceae bacterium]|jgi:hypothetical protein|nr:hypothetical protein [Streptosporangiaceae bacterium]
MQLKPIRRAAAVVATAATALGGAAVASAATGQPMKLLGLNPRELQAVQIEHTQALPGL